MGHSRKNVSNKCWTRGSAGKQTKKNQKKNQTRRAGLQLAGQDLIEIHRAGSTFRDISWILVGVESYQSDVVGRARQVTLKEHVGAAAPKPLWPCSRVPTPLGASEILQSDAPPDYPMKDNLVNVFYTI